MASDGFDERAFNKLLRKYPLLDRLLLSGILTKKILRSVLRVDKREVDTLHGNLRICGAIYITSSVMFRATDTCINYLNARGEKKEK